MFSVYFAKTMQYTVWSTRGLVYHIGWANFDRTFSRKHRIYVSAGLPRKERSLFALAPLNSISNFLEWNNTSHISHTVGFLVFPLGCFVSECILPSWHLVSTHWRSKYTAFTFCLVCLSQLTLVRGEALDRNWDALSMST